MKSVKFLASIWFTPRVHPIEVIRESDKTVWYRGEVSNVAQQLKDTKYVKVFDTRNEALLWIQSHLKERIRRAESRLFNEQKALNDFNRKYVDKPKSDK